MKIVPFFQDIHFWQLLLCRRQPFSGHRLESSDFLKMFTRSTRAMPVFFVQIMTDLENVNWAQANA